MFDNQQIAFIGTGNMSEAIIRGLLANQLVTPAQIIGSNPLVERNTLMAETYGIMVTQSNREAVASADVVVLGVKPQYFTAVATELEGNIAANTLIVSIMAGTTLAAIESGLGCPAIARSMPNTPAQVGAGMTVWTVTSAVSTAQRAQAQAIFAALGEEAYVMGEHYIDMATAINGSGPGYVFLMLEAMVDTAVHMGFARDIAQKLVLQTVGGSVQFAQASDMHLAQLRNQVTSPGGTTAAGLAAMEQAGLRNALADGIWAAYERSVALGKKG